MINEQASPGDIKLPPEWMQPCEYVELVEHSVWLSCRGTKVVWPWGLFSTTPASASLTRTWRPTWRTLSVATRTTKTSVHAWPSTCWNRLRSASSNTSEFLTAGEQPHQFEFILCWIGSLSVNHHRSLSVHKKEPMNTYFLFFTRGNIILIAVPGLHIPFKEFWFQWN